MKTTFARKPSTLRDVLHDSRQIRSWHEGTDNNPYYVAEEKHLIASDWSAFIDSFLEYRDWISEFSRRNYPYKGEAAACIRVTGENSDIVLLVNPEGYDYARYVGIESACESSAPTEPSATETQPPEKTSAPDKPNTIVIHVWRGLVSDVYATDPDTQVIVVDEDADETDPDDMPEHKVY